MGHIWDSSNHVSLYDILKDALHVPYKPPAEALHVFIGLPPIRHLYTKSRLNLINQLSRSQTNIEEFSLSALYKLLVSEGNRFIGIRSSKLDMVEYVSQAKPSNIHKYIHKSWEDSWRNFCVQFSQPGSLLQLLTNPIDLLNKRRLPLQANSMLVGQLCSLLTGHTRLQLHKYKLGHTFSPTCICLRGDETPLHFIQECVTYQIARSESKPTTDNWGSIIDFLRLTKRKP